MEFFNNIFPVLNLVKIVFLLIDALYVIFLIIVYNQVSSMDRIINEEHNSQTLSLIAVINILFAVSLFLIAVVIL